MCHWQYNRSNSFFVLYFKKSSLAEEFFLLTFRERMQFWSHRRVLVKLYASLSRPYRGCLLPKPTCSSQLTRMKSTTSTTQMIQLIRNQHSSTKVSRFESKEIVVDLFLLFLSTQNIKRNYRNKVQIIKSSRNK